MQVYFFSYFVRLLCFIKGVKYGRNVKFNGYPRMSRAPNSTIAIGDNCLFNSSRNSARIGLVKRCAFVTLNKGAEIRIGKNTGGTGATIAAFGSITIGNNVLLGAYTTIFDSDFHNPDPGKRDLTDITIRPVVIEDNVFLGMNCMVLKGVTIGKNSVIGANSVVISSIPPNSVAMGNPCKVILKRNWGKPVQE
ncbi:MAG: acyltransferase [Bacteroidales bacterium]|nr:acyltransferase [Bacteroidales bacterium]